MIYSNSFRMNPISIPYNWGAEYVDGTYVTEYDLKTHKANQFNSVNKDKLLRFGLLGLNHKLFFECGNGIFNIAGSYIEVIYKTDDKEYYLTGHNQYYNDIITYKDAVSDANLASRNTPIKNSITQFNFGYKTKINKYEEVNFSFQPLICLPSGKHAYIQVKLVSDVDLNGEIQFKRNGKVIESFKAPLEKGYAGIINWTIK